VPVDKYGPSRAFKELYNIFLEAFQGICRGLYGRPLAAARNEIDEINSI
jgi:hypothetical protein